MPSVYFQNADTKPIIKNKQKIKQFIPLLFAEYKKDIQSISFIFCSDEYLLSLNRQFLSHDYYTDILTFDLSSNKKIVGEIYISIDRVLENATKENVSFQKELLRIIFHGVLHLCGFNDKTTFQKRKMTLSENLALIKFEEFHVKQ